MTKYSKEFIEAIPKTDLHLHLDGSLRLGTLIDLAKEYNVELPSYTEEGLNELVFKPSYNSLDEYLKGFGLTTRVMQKCEALERISYELAYDNFNEGVRYIEVRFAPQLHINSECSFEEVMAAVDRGLKKARTEINSKVPADEPGFEFGIIVCAMRFCNQYFSNYYKHFFEAHKYSTPLDTIRMASLELAKMAIKLKSETDIQIVGFDLAGSEYGYPAENHKESYSYIHKHFLKKTVHAGEAFGPESIFQAITDLHAERIGHGLFLFDESKVDSPDIEDRAAYIENLLGYIADRRITIEVCLTSNLQTVPEIKEIKNHSLQKMLDHRLSVTFCTDNRLVSHTTVNKEFTLATDNFDIKPRVLKDIVIYGFKRSFFYRSYGERRDYVRKVIDYYESLEKKYGISSSR